MSQEIVCQAQAQNIKFGTKPNIKFGSSRACTSTPVQARSARSAHAACRTITPHTSATGGDDCGGGDGCGRRQAFARTLWGKYSGSPSPPPPPRAPVNITKGHRVQPSGKRASMDRAIKPNPRPRPRVTVRQAPRIRCVPLCRAATMRTRCRAARDVPPRCRCVRGGAGVTQRDIVQESGEQG